MLCNLGGLPPRQHFRRPSAWTRRDMARATGSRARHQRLIDSPYGDVAASGCVRWIAGQTAATSGMFKAASPAT
jgi:hypothetical protein